MKDAAPAPTILLLGGEPGETAAMADVLTDRFDCLIADDVDEAWRLMADRFVQVVICAGHLAGTRCEAAFADLRTHWPETVLISVSDPGKEPPAEASPALEQMLTRPWTPAALQVATASACRAFRLMRENQRLALEMRCLSGPRRGPSGGGGALGFERILRAPGSPMATAVATARHYASFDVAVLLIGEPGTGKAAMAEAIHRSSLRSEKPFQAFDCSGFSEDLVAASLFGTRRPENGGPSVSRAGLVRKADHGTLYLAGVDTLSPGMQLRLLRLARDRSYEALGTSEAQTSGARLIFGATTDLRALVSAGRFRSDLYFAIATTEIALPPLRARTTDIPLLAQEAAEAAGREHGKFVHGVSEAAIAFMTAYAWPGNLRELENEVTRMLILAQEPVLGPELMSRAILQAEAGEAAEPGAGEIMTGEGLLKDRLEAIEMRILRETLTRLKWNKSRSAAELGLSRVGLRAKLDRYGITPPGPTPAPEREEA
ncbi:MAG: sigma 54-interacting transcriptional regulator [Pseudomonadota bacterium]